MALGILVLASCKVDLRLLLVIIFMRGVSVRVVCLLVL